MDKDRKILNLDALYEGRDMLLEIDYWTAAFEALSVRACTRHDPQAITKLIKEEIIPLALRTAQDKAARSNCIGGTNETNDRVVHTERATSTS